MKYDVILVLGRGIYNDGSLPESAKACVEKAVELIAEHKADRIIFSGKWSYKFDYIPPKTEAEAMRNYASELGVSSDIMLIEEKSVSTVTNLIYSKRILEKHDWRNLIIIYIDPFEERTKINVRKVLGPVFFCNFEKAKFTFPEKRFNELLTIESQKVNEASDFLGRFDDGDDRSIFSEVKKFHNNLGQELEPLDLAEVD